MRLLLLEAFKRGNDGEHELGDNPRTATNRLQSLRFLTMKTTCARGAKITIWDIWRL